MNDSSTSTGDRGPGARSGRAPLSMAVLVVLRVGTGYLFSVGSTFFFCSAKLAGIRQSGENAAPAAAGGPATAEPAKGSAVQAKPQPDKKAAA